jgi:two-component system response regulator MprA
VVGGRVTVSTTRPDQLGDIRVRTILIIDDDATVRDVCSIALTEEGYLVETATDGLDALDRIGCAPDVVVLDLLMPRMDGFAFLRRLRALAGHERTPVLLLTATGSSGESLAGAQAVLRKPFVLDALLRQVADLANA